MVFFWWRKHLAPILLLLPNYATTSIEKKKDGKVQHFSGTFYVSSASFPFHCPVDLYLNITLFTTRISNSNNRMLSHCCKKCHQNLQVKTLLQMYTDFTCRICIKTLFKVFNPRNRSNPLLKLQFLVLQLDFSCNLSSKLP